MSMEQENRPAQPQNVVGSAELLVEAVQAFKSGGHQTLGLSVFGIFLPLLLNGWLAAPAAGRASSAIWKIAQDARLGGGITPATLPALMSEVTDFMIVFVCLGLLATLVFSVSYACLVYLSLHHMRPWAFPRLTMRELAGDMTRLVLRRGILLAALVLSMIFATQSFVMTSLFLAAMSLMAPVLMIAEHKSAVRSLLNSLTLRYARRIPMGGLSAFLALVTVGGLFFAAQFGLGWLAEEGLYWIGAHMPPVLSVKIPAIPFTWGFALVDGLHALALTMLVILLPGTTAALYMRVHFRTTGRGQGPDSARDLSIRA